MAVSSDNRKIRIATLAGDEYKTQERREENGEWIKA